MEPLKSIEERLATALSALDSAARYVREAEELETSENLRRLGHAINSVWELRETIHTIRPDLKPSFLSESEEDPDRFEELGVLADDAFRAERAGNKDQAVEGYAKLLKSAAHGHFELVAEAGLYRLLVRNAENDT